MNDTDDITPEERAEEALGRIAGWLLYSPPIGYRDLISAVGQAIREAEERGRKAGREQLEAEVVRSFAGHSVTVGEFIRKAREIGGGRA
jgi:hypothetical protein